MSLKNALTKAKGLWKKGKDMKPSFESEVEDGKYLAKITKAELGESESSGRLQVGFEAVITTGESKGKKIRWYDGLKTEQNMMFFARTLARLGFEVPEDLNDLPAELKKLEKAKPVARVTVKTDGEFQNVRINKKADDTGEEEDVADEAATEDEAEPDEPAAEAEPESDDPEPEAEEPEPDADEVPEIEVGLRVAFDWKGEELVGEVKEVMKDDEKVKIKVDKLVYTKKIEDIRPAPKTKVKKK